jgi:biopolymer transport protein ExbD
MNASWRRGGCIARVYVKSVTDLKPEIKESTTQTHAVKIDNPSHSRPPPATPPDVIDLSIDFDGTLQWNKRTVDRTTMQSYITQEAVKNPQPEVHIAVDKFSRYEIVAQTLADLQHRGLKKIGFVNNEFF